MYIESAYLFHFKLIRGKKNPKLDFSSNHLVLQLIVLNMTAYMCAVFENQFDIYSAVLNKKIHTV